MRQKGMARTVGLVFVVLVVVGFGLYVATRSPVAWPAEARRVTHPAGFSVVAPPDWEHFLVFAAGRTADAIRVVPKQSVGNTGAMTVSRVIEPVTDDGLTKKKFQPITFQGQPAYVVSRENPFAVDHFRSVLFERDGTWFDITIRRPTVDPLDTGVWLAYAESFRVEPVRTPASQPATLPTTTLSVTP